MSKHFNPYKGHPVLGKRPNKRPTREEALKVLNGLFEFHDIAEPDKDPLAFAKLVICLAHEFVPALQPQKRGRPRDHTVRDIMWAYLEYGRVRLETGLPSEMAIIERMAEDVEFWQEMGLGETKKKIGEQLRYILTDRIKQPDIAPLVMKEFRKLLVQLEEATKKAHRH